MTEYSRIMENLHNPIKVILFLLFQWTSAGLLLEKHSNRSLQLAPPQITELGRLLNFNDVDNLKQFAWERSAVRANRWLPVPCLCKDGGILYLYPGIRIFVRRGSYLLLFRTVDSGVFLILSSLVG